MAVYRPLHLIQMSLISCVRKYSKSKHMLQQNVIISGPLAKMMNRGKAIKKKKSGQIVKSTANGMNLLTQNLMPEFIDTSKSSGYVKTSAGSIRRANQVSFVLYDCITQIINSGEFCPIIASLSIEITQVKMLPDFSAIYIYWSPSGTSQDDEVDKLFKEKENHMRSLLITERPIAKIPKVIFQKDVHKARILELEKLFEIVQIDIDRNIEAQSETNIEEPIIYVDDDKAKNFEMIKDSFEDSVTEVVHFEKEGHGNSNKQEKLLHFEKNHDSLNKTITNQFRDDLYGLQHTQLQKKIEIWNTKLKHRKTQDEESEV